MNTLTESILNKLTAGQIIDIMGNCQPGELGEKYIVENGKIYYQD